MIEIEGRTKLYRVGNTQGLWYDADGNYTGLIHKLEDGAAGALPMGFDPIFRTDGQKWISVTTSLETLRNWFSEADMRELLPQGYVVEEIDALRHRQVSFEGFSHEVYSARDAISIRTIDPTLLYPGLRHEIQHDTHLAI